MSIFSKLFYNARIQTYDNVEKLPKPEKNDWYC